MNAVHFDRAGSRKGLERLLLNSHQLQHVLSDDRERMTSARQAAEALFAPKKQLTQQPVPDSMPSVELSARKPRILRALPPTPARLEQGEAPASSEQRMMTEIPSSQFARIRACVKYGMMAAQVAEVYGVAVGVIGRILRQT